MNGWAIFKKPKLVGADCGGLARDKPMLAAKTGVENQWDAVVGEDC
jgi:hypothetical protein